MTGKGDDDKSDVISLANSDITTTENIETDKIDVKAPKQKLDENKVQQFDVYVNIIQVKEVNLANLNCFVTVNLDGDKKSTDTKKGTDSTYFNQVNHSIFFQF